MMSHAPDWTDAVPAMAALDTATRTRLRDLARPVSAPAGTCLFREGSPCQAYLILLAGQVRVSKTGETGREIVLYRVEPGQTCVVTTACLMAGTDYDAEGIAETDIQARALPLAAFRTLLAGSASFRDFVFRAYGLRIADLLLVIQEVAFGRIDQRLASHLLALGHGQPAVRATHQELAVELGTVREVVSRQLKDFEHRGWLRLSRGQIELADPDALAGLARKT